MKQKAPNSPRVAKTFNQLCQLQTDNINSKTSWLLVDEGVVYIHNQIKEHPSTGSVTLTRREFNRFVDWYNKNQKPRRRA